MFNFECMQHKGKAIGICIERYYVGSCCYFNSSDENSTNDDKYTNKNIHQQQIDHSSFDNNNNSTSNLIASHQNKLSKIIKPNKTTTLEQQESTSKRPNNKLIDKVSNFQKEKDKLNTLLTTISNYLGSQSNHHQNYLKNQSSTNQTALNDSVNLINSTRIYSNYTEQTKPISLIDHQTTASSLDFNYLLANSTSNNNLNNASFSIVDQSTSLIKPFNNSSFYNSLDNSSIVKKLIDKNLTANNQINSIFPDENQSAITTTTETSLSFNTTNALLMDKYFMNQG